MAKKNTNITLTNEELQAIIVGAVAQALAAQTPSKSANGKGTSAKQKKTTKGKGTAVPTTRTEAVAAWKAERNITDDTRAKYNSIYDAKFTKDWAKWTASAEYKALTGKARKEANQAKAKELRNGYRKQAGMNAKSFEK